MVSGISGPPNAALSGTEEPKSNRGAVEQNNTQYQADEFKN